MQNLQMHLQPKLCIGEFPVNTRHHYQNVRGGAANRQEVHFSEH